MHAKSLGFNRASDPTFATPDVDAHARFREANEARLIRCTWATSRVVALALLSFTTFVAVRGELYCAEILAVFAAGLAAVFVFYQLHWYRLGRYAVFLACAFGTAACGFFYGASSYAVFLSVPASLAAVTLFRQRAVRLTFLTLVVAVSAANLYTGDAYAHPVAQGPAIGLYRLLFMAFAAGVSFVLLRNFFGLDLDFRERARDLHREVDRETQTLQAQGVELERQARLLAEANAELQDSIARGIAVERQLSSSNEQLEQFAYAASHDLKEPLRSITSFVQLIRRKTAGAVDGALDEDFDAVVGSSQRMSTLLDDLLGYSRIGRVAAPGEACTVLAKALTLVGHGLSAKTRDAEATVHLPDVDAALTVGMPREAVTTVLTEVLDNALAHARPECPPTVHVELTTGAAQMRVTVRDDGPGIAAADAERVFELFYRTPMACGRTGSGVGLAVVRKLMRHHGGDCGVLAGEGRGATVWLAFPADKMTSHN